jgi:hypothetical protein
VGEGEDDDAAGDEEQEKDAYLGLGDSNTDSLTGAKGAIHGHWRTEVRPSALHDLASGRAIRDGRTVTDLCGIGGLGGWSIVVDHFGCSCGCGRSLCHCLRMYTDSRFHAPNILARSCYPGGADSKTDSRTAVMDLQPLSWWSAKNPALNLRGRIPGAAAIPGCACQLQMPISRLTGTPAGVILIRGSLVHRIGPSSATTIATGLPRRHRSPAWPSTFREKAGLSQKASRTRSSSRGRTAEMRP